MSCVDRVAKIIWQNDRSGLAGLVAEGIRYVQGKGEEESLSRNGWSGMASLRLMAWYRKIKNRIKNDKTIRKSSDLGALVGQSNADSGALRCSSSVFRSKRLKKTQETQRDSKLWVQSDRTCFMQTRDSSSSMLSLMSVSHVDWRFWLRGPIWAALLQVPRMRQEALRSFLIVIIHQLCLINFTVRLKDDNSIYLNKTSVFAWSSSNQEVGTSNNFVGKL